MKRSYPNSTPTRPRLFSNIPLFLVACFALEVGFLLTPFANAQSEVTGAIKGRVVNSQTNEPVVGAAVQIINLETQTSTYTRTDANGAFMRQLPSGRYKVTVKALNFRDYESDRDQHVSFMKTTSFPIALEPLTTAAVPTPMTSTPERDRDKDVSTPQAGRP